MYEIEITPEGLRPLNRLPDNVRQAALETIIGPIAENPQRLGNPLVGEFEDLHGAATTASSTKILEVDAAVGIHPVQCRRDLYRRPGPALT